MPDERYQWQVIYHDDSHIYEQDATHGFLSIPQEGVKHVLIVSLDGQSAYRVDIPSQAQPIFFRRRQVALSLLDESSTPQPTIHCIGWKQAEQAVYLFVFEDGSTLLTSDLQAV